MGGPVKRAKPRELIADAGYAGDFGDEVSASVSCIVCAAEPPDGVEIRLEDDRAFCHSCSLDMPATDYLLRAAEARKRESPAMATQRAIARADHAPACSSPAPAREATPVVSPSPQPPVAAEPVKPRWSEKLIIGVLAFSCFVAGLMAAGLSGWANHQAFGAMVDDPFQSRVWSWTGVIASICSFGGFTFVYWHLSARRWKEGVRAALFAIAGAVTSIVGTEMFMANQDRARAAEAEALLARQPVIEAQIADWRAQLSGIPAGTRTVEGLEAYIAEVERVGRTHQKPYRDAKIELGQARRRAELESNIENARETLLTLGASDAAQNNRRQIPSVFFAAMLEVFASQGTSIGLVALLILLGGSATQRTTAT